MLFPGIRAAADSASEPDRSGTRLADRASRKPSSPVPVESSEQDGSRQRETTGSFDEESFELFYQRTAGPLWGYLRRISGRTDLADDLLQDAYLRFLNRPFSVPEVVDDVAYLYRIATNLLRDRWRREQREQGWLRDKLRLRDRWLVARDTQQRVDLERGLAQLAPRDRALLWLAYVDGYDHREIAEILAVKAGSVRVMLFRAKKKLALKLAPGKNKEKKDEAVRM